MPSQQHQQHPAYGASYSTYHPLQGLTKEDCVQQCMRCTAIAANRDLANDGIFWELQRRVMRSVVKELARSLGGAMETGRDRSACNVLIRVPPCLRPSPPRPSRMRLPRRQQHGRRGRVSRNESKWESGCCDGRRCCASTILRSLRCWYMHEAGKLAQPRCWLRRPGSKVSSTDDVREGGGGMGI